MEEKSFNSYLLAIYLLEESGAEPSTIVIARSLKIQPGSVTEMLKKLAAQGYVNYLPYQGASLTGKGNEAAKKIIRKHRLLETFLKNTLKIEDKECCRQAAALQHSLSDTADQQLCIFLHRPLEGPVDHGSIPHCTKKISCGQCLKSNNVTDLSRVYTETTDRKSD